MISNLQKPIISGFDSKSDADKIVKEKDLSGKIAIDRRIPTKGTTQKIDNIDPSR